MSKNFIEKMKNIVKAVSCSRRMYGPTINFNCANRCPKRYLKFSDLNYIVNKMTPSDLNNVTNVVSIDSTKIIKIFIKLVEATLFDEVGNELSDSQSYRLQIKFDYIHMAAPTLSLASAIFNFDLTKKDYEYYLKLIKRVQNNLDTTNYYKSYNKDASVYMTKGRHISEFFVQFLDLDQMGIVKTLPRQIMRDFTNASQYIETPGIKLYGVTVGNLYGLLDVVVQDSDWDYFWNYKKEKLNEEDYIILRMAYETSR